jgi:hypothetical protein
MKRWIVLLVTWPVFAQNPQVVGTTTWKLNGAALTSGQKIEATRSNIEGSSASDLVLACGSEGWLAYSCRKDRCTVSVCQKTGNSEVEIRRVDPGGWASPKPAPGNMLTSLVRHEGRSRGVILGVRGGGNIGDAVLQQSGAKVAWGPALARLLEGDYCFEAKALPEGSSKPFVFTLQWNRAGDGAVEVPGLAAGLYSLERGTSDEKAGCRIEDPDAAKAWVLIASGPDFSRLRDLWESYVPGLNEVAEAVSAEVSATVSHSILASLADMAGR